MLVSLGRLHLGRRGSGLVEGGAERGHPQAYNGVCSLLQVIQGGGVLIYIYCCACCADPAASNQ